MHSFNKKKHAFCTVLLTVQCKSIVYLSRILNHNYTLTLWSGLLGCIHVYSVHHSPYFIAHTWVLFQINCDGHYRTCWTSSVCVCYFHILLCSAVLLKYFGSKNRTLVKKTRDPTCSVLQLKTCPNRAD